MACTVRSRISATLRPAGHRGSGARAPCDAVRPSPSSVSRARRLSRWMSHGSSPAPGHFLGLHRSEAAFFTTQASPVIDQLVARDAQQPGR